MFSSQLRYSSHLGRYCLSEKSSECFSFSFKQLTKITHCKYAQGNALSALAYILVVPRHSQTQTIQGSQNTLQSRPFHHFLRTKQTHQPITCICMHTKIQPCPAFLRERKSSLDGKVSGTLLHVTMIFLFSVKARHKFLLLPAFGEKPPCSGNFVQPAFPHLKYLP